MPLRFLYEDGVEVTGTNVAPLMYAAEKYRAEELRATCVKYMLHNMNSDSVVTVLDLGVLYEEERLVKTCINLIVYGAPENLDLLKEHHVSERTLKMLINCSALAVKETELFKICDTWANVECRKRELEVNQANKREVLDGILPGIRFCSMTVEEMARDVSPTGLLTTQEELKIYRSFGSADKSDAPFPHEKRTTTKLRVSLPNDVMNAPYEQVFHIRFSCSNEFILLGFEFIERGVIQVDFDHCTREQFSVAAPPCIIYLTKPRIYRAMDRFDIRRGSRGDRGHFDNDEIFTVPCVSTLPPHDTVFTMEVQDCTPRHRRPPFSTLIITY